MSSLNRLLLLLLLLVEQCGNRHKLVSTPDRGLVRGALYGVGGLLLVATTVSELF